MKTDEEIIYNERDHEEMLKTLEEKNREIEEFMAIQHKVNAKIGKMMKGIHPKDQYSILMGFAMFLLRTESVCDKQTFLDHVGSLYDAYQED